MTKELNKAKVPYRSKRKHWGEVMSDLEHIERVFRLAPAIIKGNVAYNKLLTKQRDMIAKRRAGDAKD